MSVRGCLAPKSPAAFFQSARSGVARRSPPPAGWVAPRNACGPRRRCAARPVVSNVLTGISPLRYAARRSSAGAAMAGQASRPGPSFRATTADPCMWCAPALQADPRAGLGRSMRQQEQRRRAERAAADKPDTESPPSVRAVSPHGCPVATVFREWWRPPASSLRDGRGRISRPRRDATGWGRSS